jgi:hypothetical protein
MLGRCIWSLLVILLVAFLATRALPGRRGAPATPAIATVQWHMSTGSASSSFDEVTDLGTCREIQRQIAHERQHEGGDGHITLACHRSRTSASSL